MAQAALNANQSMDHSMTNGHHHLDQQPTPTTEEEDPHVSDVDMIDNVTENGTDKTEKEEGKEVGNTQDTLLDEEEEEEDEEEADVFMVESILDMRKVGGRAEYLIKWVDYPASSNTWEPEENLQCDELLVEFKKAYKAKEAAGKSGAVPQQIKEPRKRKSNAKESSVKDNSSSTKIVNGGYHHKETTSSSSSSSSSKDQHHSSHSLTKTKEPLKDTMKEPPLSSNKPTAKVDPKVNSSKGSESTSTTVAPAFPIQPVKKRKDVTNNGNSNGSSGNNTKSKDVDNNVKKRKRASSTSSFKNLSEETSDVEEPDTGEKQYSIPIVDELEGTPDELSVVTVMRQDDELFTVLYSEKTKGHFAVPIKLAYRGLLEKMLRFYEENIRFDLPENSS